ncbi:MAG: LamG domain-containing protein [Spirochaetes bacterium]|nr:LamG domain-containing protein [Spirochaetota bacterium]
MKYFNIILLTITIFIIIILSCNISDDFIGVNNLFLPEEKKESGGNPGYYNDITQAIADGLLAYWRMDETLGATAYDETGNYDGTINNLDNSAGKFGNSYRFKGVSSDSNINIATLSSISGTYTFSFWTYIQNTTDNQYFFESQSDIRLHIQGSATAPRLYMTYGSTQRNLGYDPTPIKNTWAHVVYVLDGGSNDRVYLYVNGINVTSPASITYTDINIDAANKRIGSNYQGTTSNLEGYLDDFAIWNRALNASEVLALFNSNGPVVKK